MDFWANNFKFNFLLIEHEQIWYSLNLFQF
jgi:hypothetical protein